MDVGMLLYTVIGIGAAMIVDAAVGCVAVLAAILLAVAVVNTFFCSYWTLAYLRLSGRTP
jgi:hypothetical protein